MQCKVGFGLVGLLVFASLAFGQTRCLKTLVNDRGVSGADIAVDDTSGGTVVAASMPTRCDLLLRNTGDNPVWCKSTVSGQTLQINRYYNLTEAETQYSVISITEGVAEEWKCISDTGLASTVLVVEKRP